MQVSHDELGARLERLRASGPLDRPLLVRVPEHVDYLTGFEPARDAPAALIVTLAVGDVVAVEPGLYVPRVGGLRIEDAWEITPDLPRRLNAFPRELVVCP